MYGSTRPASTSATETGFQPTVFELPEGAQADILLGSDGVFDGVPAAPRRTLAFLAKLRAMGPAAIAALPVEDDKTLIWLSLAAGGAA